MPDSDDAALAEATVADAALADALSADAAVAQAVSWAATGSAGSDRRSASAHVFVDDVSQPVLVDADRTHLAKALRLRAGEWVSASDGRGRWRWMRWDGSGAVVEDDAQHLDPAVKPSITIALALVKGERADWAVQKLTELGVDRIIPMVSERTVVQWDAARAPRGVQRWQAVARAAAMQSRRTWLPIIEPLATFADVVAGDGAGGLALAVPGGEPPSLATPTVLIGPEGGWSPSEEGSGRATVGLGPTILRAETAAIAVATLLGALRAGLVDHAVGC